MEDDNVLEEEVINDPIDQDDNNSEEITDTSPVEEVDDTEPVNTGSNEGTEEDNEGSDNETGDETDGEEEEESTEEEAVDLVKLLGITEIPVNIPIEFLFVYNKLLMVMIELGESMLLDCKALCSTRNMPVVECYHMFKAALAAKQLAYSSVTENETITNYYNKLADTLLNYVREQLNCITRNYKDDLSFTLPIGANGLVNLFITKKDVHTEIIVKGSDVDISEALFGIIRDILKGSVITIDSDETYDLQEDELVAQQHWHVKAGSEFVEGSSEVYINGVKYFKDSETEDYRYEEWIVEEDGVRKGVGIKILTGNFDVGETPDEIHVEAKLLYKPKTSN